MLLIDSFYSNARSSGSFSIASAVLSSVLSCGKVTPARFVKQHEQDEIVRSQGGPLGGQHTNNLCSSVNITPRSSHLRGYGIYWPLKCAPNKPARTYVPYRAFAASARPRVNTIILLTIAQACGGVVVAGVLILRPSFLGGSTFQFILFPNQSGFPPHPVQPLRYHQRQPCHFSIVILLRTTTQLSIRSGAGEDCPEVVDTVCRAVIKRTRHRLRRVL